jgi:hypothetical protein
MAHSRPRSLQRWSDAAGYRDVVVLDENGIIKPKAVVGSPASPNGMLLKRAQSWGGLACADDPGMSMGAYGFDESRRRRGTARHPAQKVQGNALRRENAPGRALQPKGSLSSFHPTTVGAIDGDRNGRVNQGERQMRCIDASDDS